MSGERGFALLAVMLVLALLGVIAGEFAFSMRLEATMVRSYREEVVGRHLVEAAVQQAIREIVTDSQIVGVDDGLLTFYRLPIQPLPRLARSEVPLGRGTFSYRIDDEEARVNLNTAPPDRLDRLLAALGMDKQARDVINDSLQDWKDPNELYRANGAESDYYLKLPVPYRARNANLQDLAELLQIRGVTPELYFGRNGEEGLVKVLTVWGSGQVNINTASPTVFKALGLSDAEVSEIVQSRATAPYAAVPPRFTGRGLSASSRTFRVEAEGFVDGQPTARGLAIVQKRSEAGGLATGVVVSWNPAAGGRR
ncbi:MAG: general secretion pathway protein GspK [Candidatus Rokubacteria bacterium]|nr:general secretion pathway protein GspK [Candidatus Rokubacteria bacterium]